MRKPKSMKALFAKDSFTNPELIYAYNFMNTLQRMVSSLGTQYNAIWRSIFYDMRTFEDMLLHRGHDLNMSSTLFEDFPKGEKVSIQFEVEVGEDTNATHVRNQLLQQIFSMSEPELMDMAREQADEEILNTLQDSI